MSSADFNLTQKVINGLLTNNPKGHCFLLISGVGNPQAAMQLENIGGIINIDFKPNFASKFPKTGHGSNCIVLLATVNKENIFMDLQNTLQRYPGSKKAAIYMSDAINQLDKNITCYEASFKSYFYEKATSSWSKIQAFFKKKITNEGIKPLTALSFQYSQYQGLLQA